MLSLILAATLAASPQPPLMFNFFDAADLLGHCAARDARREVRQALCMGYVAGAVDQLMLDEALREARERTICPPQDLTVQVAVSRILEHATWAAREPGLGAAGLVRFAFKQSYPCRRASGI